MKNLLSENMLRFGTKNLSEAARRELVLKSIMETINEHGLRNEVRRRLTEGDVPTDPNATVVLGSTSMYSGPDVEFKRPAQGLADEVLVKQSGSSLGEASKILGTMLKLVGQGNGEGQEMIQQIKSITANNYPAILWKVKHGTTFKQSTGNNYSNLGDWFSTFIDKATASGDSSGGHGSGGKGPIGAARDAVIGVDTYYAFNKYLAKFGEYINPSGY